MTKIQDGKIIIEIDPAEGTTLIALHDALVLGIEEISFSETAGDEDHKMAIFWLGKMLRSAMLDSSQANVALNGKPYRKV